jgi:hypothetical protein
MAITRSDWRNGLADLVQQSAGAVLLAPFVDIIPIDPVTLHGDHIADIIPIFRTCP